MTPFSHLLCAVDFSDNSRHALEQAAAVARAYGAGVTVFHAFVSRPAMDLPPIALTDVERERLIDDVRQFSEAVAPDLRADYRVGEAASAYEGILGMVQDIDPDLLVMGTHGRSGFRRLFLGSVTEKVIRSVPCPTLVVPPRAASPAADQPARFQRILCPVDLSESSLAALARAIELAQHMQADLRVVHVVELPQTPPELPLEIDLSTLAERAAKEARRRLEALIPAAARPFCTVETPIVDGRAHRAVLRLAAEQPVDAIVMGVHGRGAADLMLFGSTTHHVLRTAASPVLVVNSENGAAVLRQHQQQSRRQEPAPSR